MGQLVPLQPELAAHLLGSHLLVLVLLEAQTLPSHICIQDHIPSLGPGFGEVGLHSERDRVVQVVGVGEPVPDQQELVGAAAVGVKELGAGPHWGVGRHGEVAGFVQTPLLLLGARAAGGIVCQLDWVGVLGWEYLTGFLVATYGLGLFCFDS